MKVRITDELAQQIVDSAKAVVGWNVNFIDCQGRIMASTDSGRIGTYHKAAMSLPGRGRSRPYRKTALKTVSAKASIIPSSWAAKSWGLSALRGNRLSSASTVSC